MVNYDALIPETGSVIVGGSVYSFYVTSYSESGGVKERAFIRTMGRSFKRHTMNITDYNVSFDVTLVGSQFDDLYRGVGSVGSITLSFNGSYTISYFNMYTKSVNPSANADDRLIAKVEFMCSPYDRNGSPNRVVI